MMIPNAISIAAALSAILDGLASADAERMVAGGRVIDVRRFKITAAGRVALER